MIETVMVGVDGLRPAPWNARFIADERFANLCEAIRADPDFLWSRPVLALEDGTIFGGQMRFFAAREIGMTEVPVIYHDIPESLAKERTIRDNEEWGVWEPLSLGDLLRELDADGVRLDTVGFDGDELQRLMEQQLFAPSPPPAGDPFAEAGAALAAAPIPSRPVPTTVDLVCPECGLEFTVDRSDYLQ